MRKIKINEKELIKKISSLELKNYDGVIFLSLRSKKIAQIFSNIYELEIYDLVKSNKEEYDSVNKKILLVDDSSISGRTINEAKSNIRLSKTKSFVIAGKADYNIYEHPGCVTITDNHYFNFSKTWFWFVGLLAFLWVFFRTGSNPKRAIYPCQQVAIPIASTWLLSITAFFAASFLAKRILKFSTISVVAIALVWFIEKSSAQLDLNERTAPANKDNISLPSWETSDAISQVFVIDSIQPSPGSLAQGNNSVPDEYLFDPAIDALVEQMRMNGVEFYKSVSTPDGIIGTDNIVVLKCNFQWENRSGTNTDRIKGVINRIVNHPDGFTGEILIVDNTQVTQLPINSADNNSDDQNQSIIDVVNTFKDKGYPVEIMNWAYLKGQTVDEYNTGDISDGYLWLPDEGKLTYPKFKTPITEKYLSLRHGIWNADLLEYDQEGLKIIDMPVLKAHVSAGATVALKNWVGVLTTEDANNRYGLDDAMHADYFFGEYDLVPIILSATFPDLTIVDATWTNSMNHNERSDYSTGGLFSQFDPDRLIHSRILIASTDPCAASWYAAKYILHPIAYFPDRTDPDRSESLCTPFLNPYGSKTIYYASFLRRTVDYLRNVSEFPCTTDSTEMSVYYHENMITDIDNNYEFAITNYELKQNYPNPFNPTTKINYELRITNYEKAEIVVFNSVGQQVWSTPITRYASPVTGSILFDGSKFNSGVYYYSLVVDGEKMDTKKMVLTK